MKKIFLICILIIIIFSPAIIMLYKYPGFEEFVSHLNTEHFIAFGTYIIGISAIVGVIYQIPEYTKAKNKETESKNKETEFRDKERRGRAEEKAVRAYSAIREFLNRISYIKSQFSFDDEPEQEKHEKYNEYILKIRSYRIKAIEESYRAFIELDRTINQYLTSEEIKKYEEVRKIWQDINRALSMWAMIYDEDESNEQARKYWDDAFPDTESKTLKKIEEINIYFLNKIKLLNPRHDEN